jgi:anti-sigma factor RsiW
MGCRRIQKRLQSFLDGEIDSVRKAKVERHLARCDRCRQVLTEIENVGRLLETYQEIGPPPQGLAGPVLARVRAGSVRSFATGSALPLRVWLLSPFGWATAGLFLAGILAGRLIATSVQQGPDRDAQSAYAAEGLNLEIFSELPPNSLEQRYWEALAAGQGGNG